MPASTSTSRAARGAKAATTVAPKKPNGAPSLKRRDDGEKDPQFAYTLAKGLKILEAFSAGTRFLGNREFCDATGMNKSTVSRLTGTLCELGYLRAATDSGKFELGPAVLSLAYPMLVNLPLRKLARPLMQELAETLHGVVNLGVRDRQDIVFVESCRKLESIAARPEIGARRSLITTPLGQTYLVALPEARRKALMAELLPVKAAEASEFDSSVRARVREYNKTGVCYLRLAGGLNMLAHAFKSSVDGEYCILNCLVEDSFMPVDRLMAEVPRRLQRLARRIQEDLGVEPDGY